MQLIKKVIDFFIKKLPHFIGMIFLFSAQHALAVYTFPGSMPAGCSGSGGNYTCSSSLTFSDHVTFADSGTVTITINGGLTVNNYTIGSPSDSANVTFVVNGTVTITAPTIYANITANGSNNININGAPSITGNLTTTSGNIYAKGGITGNLTSTSGNITLQSNSGLTGNITLGLSSSSVILTVQQDTTVNGNISATATGSSADITVYIMDRATINGPITATGPDYTKVYVNSDAKVYGNILATGNDDSEVTLYTRSLVIGDVNSTATDVADGDVKNWGTVNGDIYVSGDIYNYSGGVISGCAQTEKAWNALDWWNVHLYSGSSTYATCSGTNSCSTDTSYIYKDFSVTMPPICVLSATKIAQYNFDETSWNGTTNETKDTAGYTGGPYDGQGIGTTKPTADRSAPALSGTTGTCGYASFSGNALQSAFTLDGLPILTTTGEKTTVSFWMYWDGNTNYSTPIGWNLYALSIGNNVFGFDTFNGDRYGISSSALAIGWRHIVAVFNNGNVTQSQLFIDGVKQTLSQVRGSPNNSNAFVQSTLNIARITRTDVNNLGFNGGRIDEVKVYNGEMTQAQVTADYTSTHTCTGMPNLLANYHFEESTWTTASGQVIDASGIGYHGTVAKSSNTLRAQTEDAVVNRFIGSNPGTCGYAVFGSDGPIVLPSNMPNLTGSFTFATWYIELSSTSTARRIFADDYNEAAGGYIFSANDGGAGKLRFAKRSTTNGLVYTAIDTPAVITTGIRYFIAVSVNAVNQTATIYVFNTSGTLLNQTAGSISYFGASNNGNMTIGGAQTSAGNVFLNHARMDEVSIYNRALSQAEILALLQTNHTCIATNVAAANFNCVITGGSADTGRLYTQLSNTGFNIDVVALKSDRTTETSYVTSGTKNVTLEWMSAANNTCTTGTLLTPSTTVTFSSSDNGRKTVSVPAINKAYRDLRCRITDANQTPSVVGCSSDNFAVRPTSITVTSTDAIADAANNTPWRNENATPTFKAGTDAFNLTATTGVVGYDGTPLIATPTRSDYNDVYSWAYGSSPISPDNYSNPTTPYYYRAVGTVTGSFSAANSATGNATGNFTYSEAGYFRFQANSIFDTTFTAVDSANGDCTTGFSASGGINACSFGNTSLTNFFGRFIPDHFAITPSTTTPACSNAFTYFGQDGLSTTFTVQAQNAANQVTQNYTNNAANENEYYGKLSLSAPANFYFTSSALPAGSSLTSTITSAGSWVRGSATVTAQHLISRPTAATAPTNITISAKPVDSDGVTMASAVAVGSGSEFRYGRINIPNTYGSELLPLNVPIEAQYWNGSSYIRNQLDSCTVLNPINISMGNYKNNLSACETQLSNTTPTMSNGKTTAKLSKSGNGNNGSVDLTLNLASVSASPNHKTCTTSTESAAAATGYSWFGATNPAARATFGLFKSPIIYMRENY